MKVVILCGGKGTRLREETVAKPKPMIEIGGKPILWHIMKIYSHYGFKEFILCLGYKGESIKEYFYHYEARNADFTIDFTRGFPKIAFHNSHCGKDWKITLIDTGCDALKGARIKKIEKYLNGDDDFMLTYGDGVANVNLGDLLAWHRTHGKIATVTGVRPPSRFGELNTQGDLAISFNEKPQVSQGLINGGFFVLNKEIFGFLNTSDNCDFERGPLEEIAAAKQLMVYRHPGEWMCMDTPRDMEYLNRLWSNGNAFWKTCTH